MLVFPIKQLADVGIRIAYIVCYFPLLVIGLIFVVDPLEANSLTGLVALAGSAASLTGK